MTQQSPRTGEAFSNTSYPIVVPPEKEVVLQPGIEHECEGKIVIPQPYEAHAYYYDPPAPSPKSLPSFLSRKKFIIYTSILVTIIIAAAITIPLVILRSRAANASSNQSTGNGTTIVSSTASITGATVSGTAAPKPSGSPVLSPIAVVLWPDQPSGQGEYGTKILYQNGKGQLQTSQYSSKSNKTHSEFISAVDRNGGASFGISNFPISSGEQLEMFYTDTQGFIREWNWTPEIYAGQDGSLNSTERPCAPKSPIRTYWPFVFYANQENRLSNLVFVSGKGFVYGSFPVTISKDGGDIAAVPATQALLSMSIIYRNAEGNLVEYIRMDNEKDFHIDDPPALQNFPITSHFTTFSFPARLAKVDTASSMTPLTTVLIYQSPTNNTIYYRYRSKSPTSTSVSGTPWQSPQTDPVFNDAEKGTSIACTTGFSHIGITMTMLPRVTRCYFQVGTKIREVEATRKPGEQEGLDWKTIGWVDGEQLS